MDGYTPTQWHDVGLLDDIPPLGARTVATARGDIAIFRTADDQVFALDDACPHKAGKLSMGIVHGHTVTCPLHGWRISLITGQALGEDAGCVPVIPVKVDAGRIYISRREALQGLV